ncbi:MAG: GNAT family N-acetyltransferase [Magnetospiraceae bacterium]
MSVTFYDDLEALPAAGAALFAPTPAGNFYDSAAWWHCLVASAVAPGTACRFALSTDDQGQPEALLPLQCSKPGKFASLTNMYSMEYQPMLRPNAPLSEALNRLARGLRAAKTPVHSLWLDSLPEESALLDPFCNALRKAGYALHRYHHFVNWYEDTAGKSLDAYMADRPSKLKNTIKRKRKALERDHQVEMILVTDSVGLDAAMADYDAIYAKSWKQPEPYPNFVRELARAAAEAGTLRMGVLKVDGVPAAAQVWLVFNGRATIYKLAYDEDFKKQSVGSILSVFLTDAVLNETGIDEIDFGRGDDSYKKDWLNTRRERGGLVAAFPFSLVGGADFARHILPQRLKTALGRG